MGNTREEKDAMTCFECGGGSKREIRVPVVSLAA
jgi:hypothetical protein